MKIRKSKKNYKTYRKQHILLLRNEGMKEIYKLICTIHRLASNTIRAIIWNDNTFDDVCICCSMFSQQQLNHFFIKHYLWTINHRLNIFIQREDEYVFRKKMIHTFPTKMTMTIKTWLGLKKIIYLIRMSFSKPGFT